MGALPVIRQESSVIVRGSLRADARAPGGVEMGLRSVQRVSAAEGFPITPKEHGPTS
jgi:asparaginyl-tRNA synthetase